MRVPGLLRSLQTQEAPLGFEVGELCDPSYANVDSTFFVESSGVCFLETWFHSPPSFLDHSAVMFQSAIMLNHAFKHSTGARVSMCCNVISSRRDTVLQTWAPPLLPKPL